mmetsp:Transcript_16111/g.48272  ORF Transcript_16111/g.48272 Transcript_16111/m.48272 type:complete len:172 (+) Transcript_16111:347-862(+)|eukprot:CAMPEP_0206139020 /NCGR_PEP_ID=MMETSP1473-20131121/4393_1 /ASSEMBLY_ACC=CAM_ASM_001109 /TAXON_ID=1461547 /ORGANISM="Stichococcus sp, Strain RCC1054" /LENGTH=171 /DNA_ID=CAMNT_0053532629 /DNA_START=338 /DNA_END=853 /DNA_ORIENTATION=+
METINSEILSLTYGSIVRQLITDLEDMDEVNKQLDVMGYNMGIRLIDEFLANARITKCGDFKETAENIAKVGFKMFLNTTATVVNWNADNTECGLVLEDNLLIDFVELPEACSKLSYCQLLCGVIRGALEMVNISAECSFSRDTLHGDDTNEIHLKFTSQKAEAYPYKDDD